MADVVGLPVFFTRKTNIYAIIIYVNRYPVYKAIFL
jgi:hypothetical protein